MLSLVELYEALKPNTKLWAKYWIDDGAPDAPYENEHHIITAKLRPFRLAYNNASDAEREELLREIT